MDSLCELDSLEIRVPSHTGLGGAGLIPSHQACEVAIDAAQLFEFWSPPQFRVGARASGWGVGGGDELRDLGKAVVKPEVKGVWSGESRGGGESNFSWKRRYVIPIRMLRVKAPERGLYERGGE